MSEGMKGSAFLPPEGGRNARDAQQGGSGPRRWSAGRRTEVVLRILRGEPLDALSRELAVDIYRLEQWRDQALRGMQAALKERAGDPVAAELAAAMQRIGELTMDNELLRMRCETARPFGRKRSTP